MNRLPLVLLVMVIALLAMVSPAEAGVSLQVDPPAAPTNLVAIGVSSTQIDLTWKDNALVETSYRIERSLNGTGSWAEIGTTSANIYTFSDVGLVACQTYVYRVRAHREDTNEYSAFSTVDSAVPPSELCPPTNVHLNVGVFNSTTYYTVVWQDNATTETSYRIERSWDGVEDWIEIGTVPANTTGFSDTEITECLLFYHYRVRAHRASDNAYSDYGQDTGFITLIGWPGDPCWDVAHPYVYAFGTSQTEATIQWRDISTDETSFGIERSLDQVTWEEIATAPPVTGTWTIISDSGLTCGTYYYYRVVVYTPTGSVIGQDRATTHPCDPPNAPTDLTVTATAHTQIDLSWTDNADNETSFSIERSPNGVDGWSEIGTTSADDTTFADTNAVCSSTYSYRVRADRGIGSSSGYSNVVEADTWVCGVFADVPTPTKEWMKDWIEAFYDAQITTQCGFAPNGQPMYCPEREATRAELAVFIVRALHYPNLPYTPTDPDDHFADVPVLGKEWMRPFIEEFYGLGITTGCAANPLQYCPERPVTRAEMAVFILRALEGGSYQPPAASGYFDDVPVAGKAWMEAWIDEFYRRGITTGCAAAPLRFCPEREVTRAEMAVFILRAFDNLPQP